MKKTFKIIIAVAIWFFSLTFIIAGATGGGSGMVVTGIILTLIGVKISGLLPMDKRKEQQKIKEKEKLEELGFLESASLMHESGLPIAEKVLCKLTYYKDKITIEGSGTTFNLLTDKIRDIDIKTTTEIETFYNSSIGGAVGGAFVLGPLGAMIGGRKKKKEIKKRENFLIITYEKENEINFMVFNTDKDPLKASKLVKIFKQTGSKNEKVVEL